MGNKKVLVHPDSSLNESCVKEESEMEVALVENAEDIEETEDSKSRPVSECDSTLKAQVLNVGTEKQEVKNAKVISVGLEEYEKRPIFICWKSELECFKRVLLFKRFTSKKNTLKFTLLGMLFQFFVYFVVLGSVFTVFCHSYGCRLMSLRTTWSLVWQPVKIDMGPFFGVLYAIITPVVIYMTIFGKGFLFCMYLLANSLLYPIVGFIGYGVCRTIPFTQDVHLLLLCLLPALVSTVFVQRSLIDPAIAVSQSRMTLQVFSIFAMQYLLMNRYCAVLPFVFVFNG